MSETVLRVDRVIRPDEATAIVGTHVGHELEPTLKSPRDGDRIRLVEKGETVALITRLPVAVKARLRATILAINYSKGGVARHNMTTAGVTFGYSPAKIMARQEGCRVGAFARDNPSQEAVLEDLARYLTVEFDELYPQQAQRDRDRIGKSILDEWRMEESLWTSGIINRANVLPYHRDGNNLDTWSAMPTLRYGMAGGYLHLPEYNVVFPCGDGDVTWFYGRGLVHGVTPLTKRRPDGYRFSIVYYALKGMVDCLTYAEETVRVAERRTERERAEAEKIRARAIPG